MNLDKLLSLYKCLAKRQALDLPESSRTTACQWIQKLETVPAAGEHEKKVLLHALKLLLLSFERKQLIGPFENTPEDTEFTDFDWLALKLNDFVKMVDKKYLDRRECPKFSYGVSGNRRVLTTFQNDPLTGQHCYYACSSEPVERWDNLEGGAIPHDTVETWRQNGEWDVLNQKVGNKLLSGNPNPSIDIPRCQPVEGDPDTDFVIQNKSNTKQSKYYRRDQGAPEKSQPGHSILRTPKRLGGTIQARQYYPEEFGINQSEYFRSPRAVFENSQYDQWQAPQTESRLTDSKKTAIGVENTSIEKGTFKDNVRARLQNIRNKMNQPARVEVQPQIELEPNAVQYEDISLHEPSDEYDYDYIEDDVHSLGILSSDAMYDEDMFGIEKVVDPNSIFKNKNVNLMSHSVVKLERNTTISGNERKVTEEFLEREDVNIHQTSDSDFMKTIKSPSAGVSPLPAHDVTQHRPSRRSHRPRKIPVDEDLYNRNERAYSPADHGQFTKHSDVYGSSKGRQVLLERASQSLGYKTNKDFPHGQEDSSCKVQRGHLPQVDISERLTDICQPSFPQSFDDYEHRSERNTSRRDRYLPQVNTSERLEDVYQPDFPQSFDDSRDASEGSRARADCRHLPQVDSTERLTDVCQPSFPTSFPDSCQRSQKSPSRTGQGHLPQADVSEKLDDFNQPNFPESFGNSRHRSEGSRRTAGDRSRLPQVDISERLKDVCEPSFHTTYEESRQKSERSPRRRDRGYLPQVDISERLEDVYQPEFPESLQDSRNRSEGNRNRTHRSRLPQVDGSERLTDVCQPSFPMSYEESRQKSEKSPRRTDQGYLPQVDISERLEDVYQPEFPESFQDSRNRSEGNRDRTHRSRLPQVDGSERLTDVCQPSFPMSYEESRQKSEKSPRRTDQGYLPQVDISERLEDVYQPEFPESFQGSRNRSEGNRERTHRSRLPQVDGSERLTDVCQPSFPMSYEESRQKSEKSPRRTDQGYLPQVDISERLEDVYQPEFPESFQGSRNRSEGNRDRTHRSRLPQVDGSERLTDVCEPSFPMSYEESRQKSEKSPRRTDQGYLPQVDISERLEDVYQPEFSESFQESRHRSQGSKRRTQHSHLPQVNDSERLTDVCEPSFPTSYEESRKKSERSPRRTDPGYLPQVDVSERLEDIYQPEFPESFQDSRHRSERNRDRTHRSRLPQLDGSERLADVCQPSFPMSYEESRQKSEKSPRRTDQGYLPQVDISERLEDVYQPESPESFQDSRHRSERNRDRTHRSRLPQLDGSERLTDVCQPSFPMSYEESKQKSEKSPRRTHQGYLPQVDISERLEDVYQPEFSESFQESRHRSQGSKRRTQHSHLPQVYKQHQSEYSPEKNLDKVSDPILLFDQQDSTRRSPRHIPLKSKNLEDVSHPPQPSPKQRLKASLQRGPSRMPFPKKDPIAAQPQITERLGDYREPFRSMANYAPFQEQINPQCIPSLPRGFTTKLKLPGTFVRSGEIPLATSTSRIPPPIRHIQQQGRPPAVSRSPSRSKSPHETFRLVAPIKRSQMQHPQTGIPRREQNARIAKPSEQEHLIKKSTVKIQVTKSTYSKDQLNGPQKSQKRKK